MVGQGAAGDVVVQAARELAAAQGLQQVPARFGQDVAAGEPAAHGEDDRGDVDGGERGVDHRVHPGPDRRPAARQRCRSPSTTCLPNFSSADAFHHASSCSSGRGVFFSRRVSCAAHHPRPCRAFSPGSRPCFCAYL
ncbi:hypothetical protein ACFQ3Z_44875 [Streptomyces nogalater]